LATRERLIMETMFFVVNKDGERVPFKLNSAQADLDSTLTGRDIVPKSRQRGISTYIIAYFTAVCLSRQNMRCVIISHESDATQMMLAKAQYFVDNCSPRPIIRRANKNEILFGKTNSRLYIGTAGAKKFGRGDTINLLHCSEIAYWPDAKAIIKGLFQAVPRSGEIYQESTGNGMGNYYHRACMRAAEEKSKYRLHFFGWLSDEDCSLPLSPTREKFFASMIEELRKAYEADKDPKKELPEELNLVDNYGATLNQIAFRYDKLMDEFDEDPIDFKQEYPTVLLDCFQSTGRSLFKSYKYRDVGKLWKRYDMNTHIFSGHPKKNHKYLIGGDVAAGVGKDYSVIEIVDLDTDQQVLEYRNSRIDPETFGHKVAEMGRLFNEGFISIESNNHGILTLAVLKGIYPQHLIYSEPNEPDDIKDGKVVQLHELGVRTTAKSKPMIIGAIRRLLKHVTIHSVILTDELETYVELPDGSLGADGEAYDDTVMALGMIAKSYNKAILHLDVGGLSIVPKPDPFSLDEMLKDISSDRSGFPIASQEAW